MFLVYKITNRTNRKCYVGITGRQEYDRWSEHLTRAREGVRNSRIYAAIRKYGAEAFSREIIARAATEEEARQLEIRYIAEFGSFESGYNSNPGGHGFLKFPEEIRRKISAAQKGKIIPPEAREKMSKAKRGDSRCAAHFGDHTKKGAENPRAGEYEVRFPDGSVQVIRGLRAFIRERRLTHLSSRGKSKGYVLLRRLND